MSILKGELDWWRYSHSRLASFSLRILQISTMLLLGLEGVTYPVVIMDSSKCEQLSERRAYCLLLGEVMPRGMRSCELRLLFIVASLLLASLCTPVPLVILKSGESSTLICLKEPPRF